MIAIENNISMSRYELYVDGELASFLRYEATSKEIWLNHTETKTHFLRKGLASQLVKFVLNDARAQKLKVLPTCTFAQKVISDNSAEYLDLVPEVQRPRFGL